MRVALITGGAQRIGRALALRLSAEGAAVAVHYHSSAAEAVALCEEIRAGGGTAAAFRADLEAPETAAGLVDHVAAALGPPCILVNNAAVFANDDVASMDQHSLETSWRVNAASPILLSRAFADRAEAGRDNVVVNMLDNKLFALNPDFFSYTLSKHTLMGATLMLAMALAPLVRVVGIAPGVTLPSPKQSDANFRRSHALTYLGRGPTVDEVVETAMFLVRTTAITGEVVSVDGGQRLMNLPRNVPALVKERLVPEDRGR